MQHPPATTSHDAEVTTLREEVKVQVQMVAKAKKATQLTEKEIDHLRSKLWQWSDREGDIREKGCKVAKMIQDKLNIEITSHGRTKE